MTKSDHNLLYTDANSGINRQKEVQNLSFLMVQTFVLPRDHGTNLGDRRTLESLAKTFGQCLICKQ